MTPLLELAGIVKDYRGLRPLRIERLELAPGDSTAILGVDQAAAEVLVNLITGSTLPDRGEVRIFGKPTADIADSDAWLRFVDRIGIVSDRAVLLEGFTAIQNLAIPFSLDVEPPAADLRARAAALAAEVGLVEAIRDAKIAELDAAARTAVRLGRALALDPEILLLEHPTASVPRESAALVGEQIRRTVEGRRISALSLTADRLYAEAAARHVLTLDPATGRLSETRQGWFARFRGA